MSIFDFFKIPTSNEITGSMGEWLAKVYSKCVTNALVLHDVLIDGNAEYTSQIDLILIGNKGVYVIETKMFNDAKMYGDTQKSKWSYYNHGKKYEIYSPLKQNQKHVAYLKKFLKDFGDVPFFSVIVMVCDDFKLKGSCGENTAICNSFPAMKRAIMQISEDKPEVIADVKKQEIYEFIKSNQHIGKAAREEHKQNVIQYKKELEEFEKEKMCPYCKEKLVLRNGKNGEFYGCKNFPKCRYTLKKQ